MTNSASCILLRVHWSLPFPQPIGHLLPCLSSLFSVDSGQCLVQAGAHRWKGQQNPGFPSSKHSVESHTWPQISGLLGSSPFFTGKIPAWVRPPDGLNMHACCTGALGVPEGGLGELGWCSLSYLRISKTPLPPPQTLLPVVSPNTEWKERAFPSPQSPETFPALPYEQLGYSHYHVMENSVQKASSPLTPESDHHF